MQNNEYLIGKFERKAKEEGRRDLRIKNNELGSLKGRRRMKEE
jgi:hypothetical protein